MDLMLYEQDYYRWLTETAAALADGRFSELDVLNLVDELESMGKSQKRAIESYLNVLLLHLLKWKYQSNHRSGSWKSSIRNSRRAIQKRIAESPSLRTYPKTVFLECYAVARENAADETELPLEVFPELPPFTFEQVLDETFLP
ncbi:DUF29 domain-containing protein [Leptolyngbya sp. NK1-12]|uniref:DUF29 domain-containing protein n=1 Tax=Leptolyngbya sp. NK1-12 TaxID=2547451 RepID=A0AA96WJ28_9CYAN|nr:DUF29 domain-containing protein [Leptolyngbya sp. NK1-12]MBF2049271.1 DUF29 domain-containing protein [Elainella sp. C42_A2020_010]WNZ26080.1 DUF29 domain-containing protein [Leptolyngbya sp. NK1-12]